MDFANEPPETCLPILKRFGFHPLAIEDAIQQTHAPKLDDWGDYLYIVLNYMRLADNGNGWETEIDELDIFLGKNYIVTHHDQPVSAIDETWASCERDIRSLQDGADHLVRLHDLNESLRDLVGGALDTYLSVVNNRMNEIMKTLTTITTLFMPMSFIAAVFGMNFFLPKSEDAIWELMQRPTFYATTAILVITPIIMYIWMRRRTWI